jgi:ATP-dependent DNA ligase
MPDPLKKLKDIERKNLERGSPRFHQPMLATLTHDRFSDPQWIFERKLDGERCPLCAETVRSPCTPATKNY